jgi:hypothetical protein
MLANNAHVKPFEPIAIARSQKLQKKPLEVQLSGLISAIAQYDHILLMQLALLCQD